MAAAKTTQERQTSNQGPVDMARNRQISNIIRIVLTVASGAFLLPVLLFGPANSNAQGANLPDAGTIFRSSGTTDLSQPAKPIQKPAKETQSTAPAKNSMKVLVKGFRITKSTTFTEGQLLPLLSGFINKELSLADLEKATLKIAAFYTGQGYMVRAFLPAQEIRNGIVEIVVIEGRLGGVEVDAPANSRISREVVASYITAAQPIGSSLKTDRMERALLLLNDLPGVSATSVLQPGTEEGTAKLVINVHDKPRTTGTVDTDNNGDKAVGRYRASVGLNGDNLSGIGDQLSFRGLSSINSNYGRIGYTIPIGYNGLKVGTSFSFLHYNLVGSFSDTNASGDAWTTGAMLSYPFIRSLTTNLFGTMTYDYRRFRNKSIDILSNKATHVGSFSLTGNFYDELLGGGYNVMAAGLTFGVLDLSRCRTDLETDRVTTRAHGPYSKLLLSFSRQQQLFGKTSLYIAGSGQLAGKNLDSSEKFSLGGPQGVRAYPVNEATGDEGYLTTVELRHNIIDRLQFSVFVDHGGIKLHHDTWNGWQGAGTTPNSYSLSAAGVGLMWIIPDRLMARFSVANRLGNNPGAEKGRDNDGTKRSPQIWFQLSAYF